MADRKIDYDIVFYEIIRIEYLRVFGYVV